MFCWEKMMLKIWEWLPIWSWTKMINIDTSETGARLDSSGFCFLSAGPAQVSARFLTCWLQKPDTTPPPCFLQELHFMTTSLLFHLGAQVINFRKVQLVVKSLKGLASHYVIDLFTSLTPSDDLSPKQWNKKDFRTVKKVLFLKHYTEILCDPLWQKESVWSQAAVQNKWKHWFLL